MYSIKVADSYILKYRKKKTKEKKTIRISESSMTHFPTQSRSFDLYMQEYWESHHFCVNVIIFLYIAIFFLYKKHIP
jgi:uncharacterized protein YozE (UPF0346 family)